MQRSQTSKWTLAPLLLMAFLLVAQPSWAGRVFKVKKGKKILIVLDPDEARSVSKGDLLYLTTSSGKKRALVLVRKMKGRNVIAQLKKGKAKKGMLTQARKGKMKKRRRSYETEEASEVAETENYSSGGSDLKFGLMGAFGSASQTATINTTSGAITTSSTQDMSGSSMGVKAVLDYELFSNLGVRARLGIDQLSVTGGVDYQTDLNYIALDLLVRYYLMRSDSFGIFANLGMGIYSPMSTTTTGGPGNVGAIQADSISTTSLLIAGAGVTLPFNGWEIYGGADYLYFPPSDTVKTNVIAAKLGILFEL